VKTRVEERPHEQLLSRRAGSRHRRERHTDPLKLNCHKLACPSRPRSYLLLFGDRRPGRVGLNECNPNLLLAELPNGRTRASSGTRPHCSAGGHAPANLHIPDSPEMQDKFVGEIAEANTSLPPVLPTTDSAVQQARHRQTSNSVNTPITGWWHDDH
jgi:hypothetical protein